MKPDNTSLRVLHWNVHSWRSDAGASNAEDVVRLVRELTPDVISLVEVDETWGNDRDVEGVARATGYASIFVPSFEFGAAGGPIGGFGNAIITRLAITNVRYRQLIWPPPVYDGSEPSEQRSLTVARLAVADSCSVWIGACHLPRSNKEARQAAARLALAEMASLEQPWLLVGDFNEEPEELIGLTVGLQAAPEGVATHPADRPSECIDYGILPGGMTIRSDVLAESGSDHLPILLDILVN